MKLILNKEEFTTELAYVSEVANGQINPKQAGILFEVEGDVLTLTTSNGSAAVAITRMKLEAPVAENFSATTDAKKLVALLPLLSGKTVTLNFAETKMTAVAGKGRYSFQIYTEDAKVAIKSFSVLDFAAQTVSVNTKAFIDGLMKANKFTINKERNQYIMTNVGVSLTPDSMKFYSTDGDRAFYKLVPDETADTATRNAVLKISNSYTHLLSNMNVAERMNITFAKDGAIMKFEAGHRIAYIREQIGNLPDITNSMFPKAKTKLTKQVQIDAMELQSVVNRIKIAADAKYKRLIFDISNGVMKINARHHETAMQEFEEEMNVDGADIGTFITDGNFMSDFLAQAKEKVTILFSESQKDPVILLDQVQGLHYLVTQMI
jgi:DNA polymerase III sliding clamp (beta) subunit (PCNA family)